MLTTVGVAEIVEYGDAGLLITFRRDDPEDRWRAAQDLQSGLLARRNGGVIDVVASYETVFVSFDPAQTDHTAVADLIASCADRLEDRKRPGLFRVPAVYGGERGPDLSTVAHELAIEPADLVELHTSSPWTVRFRGSPVASPMMDGPTMPASIARNPAPRTRVAPGSIAVSGQQCFIYPVVSPGGWRLIGQTPMQLFDLAVDGLVPYRPGDQLHFYPITEDEWNQYAAMPLAAEPGHLSSSP